MKVLKFTMIWAVLLSAGSFAVAQSGYSEYLDLARENLKSGNCDAAQKYYNVYKELTGKSVSSVEVLIDDCKTTSANGPKMFQFNFNDYEVLPDDLDGFYTWERAKSACADLTAFGKSDWRLPTEAQLSVLHSRKDEIGGFADRNSWWCYSDDYEACQTSFNETVTMNIISSGGSALVRCIRKVNN